MTTELHAFDFSRGLNGWVGGFADFPDGDESFYELGWGWLPVPEPVSGQGFYISGNNHSDDLFMFIKGRISGLKPDSRYGLEFQVNFVTNAPAGCPGVGGAPGEAVFVKAGATAFEPDTQIENGDRRMNLDKGNQAIGGKDMIVLGDVANSNTDCSNPVYEKKSLQNSKHPFKARSDSEGKLWIIVGTDSGYESTTTLFYRSIKVNATLL